jgi:hypothetical protein
VVVALALGGGYWAYSQKQQDLADARMVAETAKQDAARREQQLIAAKQAAEEAQRRLDVARQQEEAERTRAQAVARRLAAEERAAARAQQQASGAPALPGAAGSIDGVYTGPVCYGPSPNDRARCYQAEATVRDGKIVGEWHGRDPGVTVKLHGEVSAIGEVRIELHAERADGNQFARANLSGTVRNGRLAASGFFFNGRTTSLSWRRN